MLGEKRCYFILFILFYLTYAYFFQGGGWNQNSRLCLIRSIIHHHSFKIDFYKEDSKEMEFVNTGDWAYYGGHYYSNKSPGLSFMAVLPFAITEYILKKIFPVDEERQILYSAYVSTLFTVTFLSALLSLLIFHLFSHFFQAGIWNSFLLSLFFGFGTLAFSYSTTFYCHQPAAFWALLSFILILHLQKDNFKKKELVAFVSGLSGGLGVLFEPSVIYLLGGLFIYLFTFKEDRRYLLFFILGCIPPGIVQGIYNLICFGSPLASSYNYSNDLVMWKVKGRLFGIPEGVRFYYLLISPYRGLFFSSPVLLMAIPGVFLAFKERRWRAEALFCTGVSVFFVVYIASFHAWNGGSTPGPRYLLPAYPFFFILAGFAIRRFSKTFKILGLFSILLNLSITIVGNEIPRNIQNPLGEVVFKNIIAGRVSINPVPFSHFKNYSNINMLADIEKWGSIQNFNSFNLGEVLFPHSILSIIPLICFWIIWGWWWHKCYSGIEKGYEA